ncbi:MAG: hypothetical protein KC422_16995 [Trueperaceae bacterium]|nr:hypothetical protein [Trueperaceae bacterium]
MTSSFTYGLVKSLFTLMGGLLGFFLAVFLLRQGVLNDPINHFYLTVLGILLAFLLSESVAKWSDGQLQKFRQFSSRIPPQAVLAAGVGATIALIITVLLNTLLENVPGFTWYWSLLLTLILVTASSWFFVVNRGMFMVDNRVVNEPRVETRVAGQAKLIDTSAIIDGRIADIAGAHFIDGSILIPKFVLSELQGIADSGDPLTRTKGRRGLEVLDKLIAQQAVQTTVINDDVKEVQEVDEKLIRLCQQKQADLITTDYNLNRVAALQGVRVLNVNQLANAIKPVFLPGERISLNIVREGREPSQGLGYLEDGTMVVVEDGNQFVGNTIDVIVTSHLQTNMGRMIFARPHT